MNILKILDDIYGFEGGGFDLILFIYLRRALKATNSQFGIFLIFEKDGNISSMAKVGEFSEKKKIGEIAKKRAGILPTVLETMKPYIANDLDRDPIHISFREEKVGSEIEYPFYLKDGKKAVLILLSKNKNHFEKKHMKEIKRIEIEITSLIEKLENGLTNRGVIFLDCKDFGNFLEESLRSKFEIYRTKRIEEISEVLKDGHIEFIFKECNLKCSKECKEIFFLSKENLIPVGILRPLTFNHKKSSSFSCSIYSFLSLSQIQEMIKNYVKESKYCIASERWQFYNKISLNIAFIQRSIIEDEIKDINVQNLAKRFNLSLPYLSNVFREFTGITIREFIYKKKMCDSLYHLVDEKPIKHVAFRIGFKDRFSFSKAFLKNFTFPPSKIL